MDKIECKLIELDNTECIVEIVDVDNKTNVAVLVNDDNVASIKTSEKIMAIQEYDNYAYVILLKPLNAIVIASSEKFFMSKDLTRFCEFVHNVVMFKTRTDKSLDLLNGNIYISFEDKKSKFVVFKCKKYCINNTVFFTKELRRTINKYNNRVKASTADAFRIAGSNTFDTSKLSFYNKKWYQVIDKELNSKNIKREDLVFIDTKNTDVDNVISGPTKLHKASAEVSTSLRRIFNYKLSEFMTKFATIDDVVVDVEKYLKDYIEFGITYDSVHIVINYINNIISKSEKGSKSNSDRKIIKELNTIVKYMKQIKFTYNVRPDEYIQVRCPHERSGHWRKYKSGRQTWVDKCVVHKEEYHKVA